jgi:hypothetical protein
MNFEVALLNPGTKGFSPNASDRSSLSKQSSALILG